MPVIDVTESTFASEVVERSRSLPVVVDFWAAWCGPCRALGPALEAAAAARDGQVVLAKVDTDAHPALSRSFGIQGIPAVKAFRDGVVVDEFVGAQPPAAVERFFDGLVPSEADGLVVAGDEDSLRRALELDPLRGDAAVALGHILHRRGEAPQALAVLERVPGGNFQVEGLAARIRLESPEAGAPRAGGPGAIDSSAPDASPPPSTVVDPAVTEGLAALDRGDPEAALDALLDALGRAGEREDLRRVIVAELDRLGVDHPLARDARRRLASALY